MKITPVIYSLSPQFIELGEDLFITNQDLDVELMKEELKTQSVADASSKVAFILLNDTLDSVKDSEVLDLRVADFKQVLKSAWLKVMLNAYSSVIKDSGHQEHVLNILLEVNEKLSSYTNFSNASN